MYERDLFSHRISAASNDSIRDTTTYMYIAMSKMEAGKSVPGGLKDIHFHEVEISVKHTKWWEVLILIIDESDLLMFTMTIEFNEAQEYWRTKGTIVVCFTATPTECNTAAEWKILRKWWGFSVLNYEEESEELDFQYELEAGNFTDDELFEMVTGHMQLNPVLICNDEARFLRLQAKKPSCFKYARDLSTEDMQDLS